MTGSLLIIFVLTMVSTFLLSVVALKKIIPILKSHKVGQKILDIGPRWHKSKEGTPTMGGIGFIIPTLIVALCVFVYAAITAETKILVPLALTLLLGVLNGLIGFIDDYTKLIKKQNEGLKAYQKLLLQIIVACIYVFAMTASGNMTTELYVPYLNFRFDLGIFYYVFAVILISGFVNSTNLTDGIDGLCSTVGAVVAAFFAVAGFVLKDASNVVASAGLIGGCVGFLVYNLYPARVFMGDTGSLYIGGIIMGMAFSMDNPLIAIVSGFVFIFETVSVMLQVASFKLTGKRIFKMSPIHHHFEKCGWTETKIVYVFGGVTLLLSVLAFFGI